MLVVDFGMEHIKRRSSSNSSNYDDSKRQKIQTTTDETNCLSRETISYFDELSNELLYEIFEYLDYFHVYEAFSNLNIRFDDLITYSNLPLKINLSLMSKSTFQRYNRDIVQPNIHRVRSLCLSNVLSYAVEFSSLYRLSEFDRMQTLILDNIEASCLEKLLGELSSLSSLSSLAITSAESVKKTNTIYRQIFRLPALKYCKLSLLPVATWRDHDEPLLASTNESSTIEHLVNAHGIYLDQLDSLLSYIPQVRRLSIHLRDSWSKRTRRVSSTLSHLTHISLKLDSVAFDQFEQVAIDLFPTIQVLHLSASARFDQAYLDSDKWKQLIVSHLPNLRIFDIELDIYGNNDDDSRLRIENQINRFTSPFWMERQWFFAQHFYQSRYGHRTIFYSTNPYRKKDCTLYKQLNEITSLDCSDLNLNSVQHLHIQSEIAMMNCIHYFPNAVELTFKDGFSTTRTSLAPTLTRIIPLNQVKKLAIECHHFSFKKMIELLSHIPHLQTLIFESMPFYKDDSMSIEESEVFRLVSYTNTITEVTFTDKCTLEKLRLLLNLCPRVQYLTITTLVKNLDSITRFLLNKTNPNTRRLCLLCFRRATGTWLEKLDSLISTETLIDDYTLKLVGSKLYICW